MVLLEYNLGSSSDMRKFKKDMENAIKEKAKENISGRDFDVLCPQCKSKVSVPAGRSLCPVCGMEIDVKLQFDF